MVCSKGKVEDKYMEEASTHLIWVKVYPISFTNAATIVLFLCITPVAHSCQSLPKDIPLLCSLTSCPKCSIWCKDKLSCKTQQVQWTNTIVYKQTKGIISSTTNKETSKPDEISKSTHSEHLARKISPASTSLRNTAQIYVSSVTSLDRKAMTVLGL